MKDQSYQGPLCKILVLSSRAWEENKKNPCHGSHTNLTGHTPSFKNPALDNINIQTKARGSRNEGIPNLGRSSVDNSIRDPQNGTLFVQGESNFT
ncbi:hypothetical protein SUGI_0758080 [Cryptomeria japonica]|nr:hypothetical protein SUGI_0758080 [Cryptomeria japonica]